MKKTIEIDLLLIGGDRDFNMHYLQKNATDMGINVRTCYTGMSATQTLNLDIRKQKMTINGYEVKTKSLFIRPDVTTYQASNNPEHRRLASDWFDIFLGWSLADENIKIFNRLYYNRNKINKATTLLLATQLGIDVAETYFTNDLTFMEEKSNGPWIEKPVHGGAHTVMLTTEGKNNNAINIPMTIQKKMDKPEYRFFRIEDKFHAFTMNSPSLDYRENQDADVKEVEFPKEYLENYIKITDMLGLDYAAADYITNPETGKLALLEINSGGMFTAFDIASKGKLCGDMLNFLVR